MKINSFRVGLNYQLCAVSPVRPFAVPQNYHNQILYSRNPMNSEHVEQNDYGFWSSLEYVLKICLRPALNYLFLFVT